MHHIIASPKKSSHDNQGVRQFSVIMQRGKGKIQILQPGQADIDWVNEAWLMQYGSELPPGTVVTLKNGRTFSVPPKE